MIIWDLVFYIFLALLTFCISIVSGFLLIDFNKVQEAPLFFRISLGFVLFTILIFAALVCGFVCLHKIPFYFANHSRIF